MADELHPESETLQGPAEGGALATIPVAPQAPPAPSLAPYAQLQPTNALAIVSLLLGAVGAVGCLCGGSIGGFLLGIPAIATGWLALREDGRWAGRAQDRGFAIAGIALGATEVLLALLAIVVFGGIFLLGMLVPGVAD
jgi:hypothetical protein